MGKRTHAVSLGIVRRKRVAFHTATESKTIGHTPLNALLLLSLEYGLLERCNFPSRQAMDQALVTGLQMELDEGEAEVVCSYFTGRWRNRHKQTVAERGEVL